jgi:hypothetical protein
MTHEAAVTAVIEQQAPPPAPEIQVPAPTAEQALVADSAFTAPSSHDHDTIVGLVGLWTGAMLLRDLAIDHFTVVEDEEKQVQPAAPPEPQPEESELLDNT